MLFVLCVVVILTGDGDGAAVLDLGGPLALVGIQYAVHIDGAGLVRKVKAAIALIEIGNSTGELVVCVLIGSCDKFGNCLGLGLAVVVVSATAAAFAAAVETVQICRAAIAGSVLIGSFGCRAVQRDVTINDYLVANGDVGISALPFLAFQIEDAICFEVIVGSSAIVGNIEGSIAVSAAGGIITIVCYLVNLSLDVVLLRGNLSACKIGLDPCIGFACAPGGFRGETVAGL